MCISSRDPVGRLVPPTGSTNRQCGSPAAVTGARGPRLTFACRAHCPPQPPPPPPRLTRPLRADLDADGRADQLYALYMEARRLVEDLSRSLEAIQLPCGKGSPPPSQQQQTSLAAPGAGDAQTSAQPIGAPQQPAPPQLMLATGSLLSSALLEVSVRGTLGAPSLPVGGRPTLPRRIIVNLGSSY